MSTIVTPVAAPSTIGRGPVHIGAPGWAGCVASIAIGTADRWRGLKPRSGGRSLLLRTRSIHGRGMVEPLGYVAIDDGGTVVRTGLLAPGRRAVAVRAARWYLELPPGSRQPDPGTVLLVTRPID